MASIITDLKENFRKGNLCIRLIYLNVAVFAVGGIAEVAARLFNHSLLPLFRWLEMPASVEQLALQPWSVLTYMFLHGGVLHLLFNMLWLYWFGNLFLQLFTTRHLRGVYLLGGICAALLYLAAFHIFPYYRGLAEGAYMLGASGAVLAVVTATAYREPNYPIRLLLLGTLRLKYLALLVILFDMLMLTSSNGGGHVAHLGGAATGLAFAYGLQRGHDLTRWLNKLLDGVDSLFTPRPHKPKMKVQRGGRRPGEEAPHNPNATSREEIDRILDKLKKSGYESLSQAEKHALFNASKR